MPTRHFTRQQLAALSVPPNSPEDVEYSDTLLADEHVTTLKYTQRRRCIFRADDGKAYAVTYEAAIDAGDYETGAVPEGYGWYGETVEAVEFEQRPMTVLSWEPVEEPADACGKCKTPFDPADTRFDGHAQHGVTPYCRRCIDRCHDNEIADHRCVICA
ncbi:hypothetical protein [Streptomyces sp. NPDC056948]|uniref:hypothetical protein n=1 Tax=Streptomyces sp. NPDC056948 TaxID=3345975 RepID=UPI00363D3B69